MAHPTGAAAVPAATRQYVGSLSPRKSVRNIGLPNAAEVNQEDANLGLGATTDNDHELPERHGE